MKAINVDLVESPSAALGATTQENIPTLALSMLPTCTERRKTGSQPTHEAEGAGKLYGLPRRSACFHFTVTVPAL
jgi:hypothetical protein